MQREHLRTAGFHLSALEGIVIDEDEAIQPELELLGQRLEVLGFGLPIELPGSEVIPPQGHILPPRKDGPDIIFVVLAVQTKQHASLALSAHELLQGLARRVQTDAHGSILATNTRPEGLVTIEHNDLVGRTVHGVERAHNSRGQSSEEQRGVRHVGQLVASAIERVGNRIPSCQVGRRQ